MIYLPEGLPAVQTLRSEGLPVDTYPISTLEAPHADHRILLLNLMPQKEVTELDFARTLAALPERLQLIPVKLSGQTYKTTPMEHMQRFYRDVEALSGQHFDRLIVTGAPLEQMPFEEVRYWDQLTRVMDWARRTIDRTLYVCWGAQAALYHFYGIGKHALPAKCFGIFAQRVLPSAPKHLLDGLSPEFLMPNSRHTEVWRSEVNERMHGHGGVVAESPESGVGMAAENDLRSVFVVGHLEYEPLTLDKEYRRDVSKGLPIQPPCHYYDEKGRVPHIWRKDALRFYYNWVCK